MLLNNWQVDNKLAAAKRPMVIIGSEQLKRDDGAALLSLVQQISHSAATQSGVRWFPVYSTCS
jgi:hypothetical protein